MQTIIGMPPQHSVIGMPQAIMRFICSQHMRSMPMSIAPIGIIMQRMPCAVISQCIFGIIGMPQHIIIGMPEHIMAIGAPLATMRSIAMHSSRIDSMLEPSIGIIMHCMPASVMVQVMRHTIGIMVAIGIAGFMPIMGMPFIGICIAVCMGISRGGFEGAERVGRASFFAVFPDQLVRSV
jgi:hypothetical protein